MRTALAFAAGLVFGLAAGWGLWRDELPPVSPPAAELFGELRADSAAAFDRWRREHPDELRQLERGELPPARAAELTREFYGVP